MQYFCMNSEREGTCYHEFQKGKWNEKTFWREDSLLLHDDILREYEIYKLFKYVNPEYSDYGETEIDKEKWNRICELADAIGGDVKAIIDEAKPWVEDTFQTEEIFTILGI